MQSNNNSCFFIHQAPLQNRFRFWLASNVNQWYIICLLSYFLVLYSGSPVIVYQILVNEGQNIFWYIKRSYFVKIKQLAHFCTDDLSFKAVASQSTTHEGSIILYAASNAVDRDTDTCMRTDKIGITAPGKTVWWKVDLGGTFNIYSINILFKNYDNYGMYHVDCTHLESCYLCGSAWFSLWTVLLHEATEVRLFLSHIKGYLY